jgi:hypothetical protein
MKAKHLKQLPKSPAARKVAHQGTFSSSKDAFLYPVRQTWCSYGAEQPQKRTIIFTDVLGADGLPTLAELTCPKHCQVQPNSNSQREHVPIKGMKSSKSRAAWAPGYVRAALEAGTASARLQLQQQQQHKQHVDVYKVLESEPEKPLEVLPAHSNATKELVCSVATAAAACAAAAGQGGSKSDGTRVATCKEQLHSSIVLLRKHLDYGSRGGRAKDACCYNKGLLLTTLKALLSMEARSAPLDAAIGLLKDLAVGLSQGKSTALALQDAGLAAAAGLGTPGRAQQLRELAKQESKTSAQRATAAQALLLSVWVV